MLSPRSTRAPGETSRITVEAATDVLVLRMPVSRFSNLLMKRPDIVQRFQMLERQL